jgi:hypothetical protein
LDQIDQKRIKNETKFLNWVDLPKGGRKYWFEIKGKFGWKARYVKEVNANEDTVRFCQEIYDKKGVLVETHQKFPVDEGHKRIKE